VSVGNAFGSLFSPGEFFFDRWREGEFPCGGGEIGERRRGGGEDNLEESDKSQPTALSLCSVDGPALLERGCRALLRLRGRGGRGGGDWGGGGEKIMGEGGGRERRFF